MRNEQVVDAWLDGESAHTNNLSTDGLKLWSYNLMIGDRMDHQIRIWDYTSSGHYHSQTTSCHVGLALRGSVGNSILMDPGLDATIYDQTIGLDRKWCSTRQAYV
jgi:hypothetical protein